MLHTRQLYLSTVITVAIDRNVTSMYITRQQKCNQRVYYQTATIFKFLSFFFKALALRALLLQILAY